MSNIHSKRDLIREGSLFESTGFSKTFGDITYMCDRASLLISESTSDTVSIGTHIQNALKYLMEKVAKFFTWLKHKLGLFHSQKTKTLVSSKEHILKYTGSHMMQIPEGLFTVDIDLKEIQESIDEWLSEIDGLQQLGTSESELKKYPKLMAYKNNIPDLTNNIYRVIVTNSFDVHFHNTDSRDAILNAVYDDIIEMDIGKIKPELVVERLASFDKFVATVNDISKSVSNRLDKFSKATTHSHPNDMPLILRFVVALIEGVLKAVNTIYSVMLYGYNHVFGVAEVMASQNMKQNP